MDLAKVIEKVLDGDREAFTNIVEARQGKVYRLCLSMTGNTWEAEDLTQEVFIQAFFSLSQLRDPGRFDAWLRAITINHCRRWYRSQPAPTPETALEKHPAPAEDHRSGLLINRLLRGLHHLSLQHRLILALHYLEDLSYEETAAFLNIPMGTVMSRLHRARRALKDIVVDPDKELEISMTDEYMMKDEIQAEITVLAKLLGTDAAAPERLRIILRRTPDRIMELLADTGDELLLDRLALLLPQLGATVVDALVKGYAGADRRVAERCARVLTAAIGRKHRRWFKGDDPELAGLTVYLVMDRVLAYQPPPVELIFKLLCADTDEPAAALVTNLFLCFGDPARHLLLNHFRSCVAPRDLHAHPVLLHALCRTGRFFTEELLHLFQLGDRKAARLALAGADALARCLERGAAADTTPLNLSFQRRTRLKWPPLTHREIGAESMKKLTYHCRLLLDSPVSDLREAAARVSGHLKDGDALDRLAELAGDQE
ncbi:RNA polymerase sigma factor, partial [bacterium]|nr:RNA polymerase sigma factor [candidate division CSSED10-310 bacterium]